MTSYYTDAAWVGGLEATNPAVIEVRYGLISDIRIADGGGTDATVLDVPADAVRLRGLTLPGMANAHSHAFHRALRGHTERGAGSFWTWREDMYRVAAALTPDNYYELARAVYAEMALAGITCVGEFHYVHHDRDGARYSDQNAFGLALIEAARAAGIRITLLDTCYLAGGIGVPLEGTQLRFGDGDAPSWAARTDELRGSPDALIGAAIHSVRAVPADQLSTVATWARDHDAPLHFHVSEQRAENDACMAAYGITPIQLLADNGALGQLSSAVHATHLTDSDIDLLAGSHTTVCMCPTTERDLADGIGPARRLLSAGAPLSLGSDSHSIIDPFEEARGLELDERLATETRGHFNADEILTAACGAGHASLGWPEAGRLEVGAPADFITVGLDSVRLAGWQPDTLLESAIFAATAADVTDVIVAGRHVVKDGRHQLVVDVAGELQRTIEAVYV